MGILNHNKHRLLLWVIPPGGLRMVKLNLSLKHILLTISAVLVVLSLSLYAILTLPSGSLDGLRNFMLVRSLTFEKNQLSRENQELNKELAKLRQELVTGSAYDQRVQAGLEEILALINHSADHNIVIERPVKTSAVKNNLIACQQEIEKSPRFLRPECSGVAAAAVGGAESSLKNSANGSMPSRLYNLTKENFSRSNHNVDSKGSYIESVKKNTTISDKPANSLKLNKLNKDQLSGELIGAPSSLVKRNLQLARSTLFLSDFGHPLLRFHSIANLSDSIRGLSTNQLSQSLSKRELYANVRSISAILKTTPIGSPFSEALLTSGYGIRRSPFGRGYKFHEGVDLAAPYGTLVSSVADGTVSYVGYSSAYGLMIQVDHNGRYTTRYAHLSKALVKSGQVIKRGDQIGRVGSSGESTGPHLHFEVLDRSQARDPAYFIWFADRLDKKLANLF
ncbi:MAG TPA: M23 family metallopeptidase [Oligoflexia bacterium]|nr:M23 family metallopeptidase [Oligoflexia bacterium]